MFGLVGPHLGMGGCGEVLEARGSGSSKCLGQTMGTVCGARVGHWGAE